MDWCPIAIPTPAVELLDETREVGRSPGDEYSLAQKFAAAVHYFVTLPLELQLVAIRENALLRADDLAKKKVSVPAPDPFSWHDPTITLDERMRLARGRSKDLRLMAAMAQLNCGSCGYLCRSYSKAIADGTEKSLTLCRPGGPETVKMIKKVLKETSTPSACSAAKEVPATNVATKVEVVAWTRKHPYNARLIRRVRLNKPGSDKATFHVEIDLGPDGPTYEVGDSLGLFPTNSGDLIGEIVGALGASGGEPVEAPDGSPTSLFVALEQYCCLSEVTGDLLGLLLSSATDSREASELRGLIDDEEPIAGFHVIDLLRRFPSARPSPAGLVRTLVELKPRLYSISSSPKRHAGQVHLTVRKVTYEFKGRGRKGVASTMLTDRVAVGGTLRVFVQKSNGFTIPSDPDAPAIMIGPGTGIAPFRAFLHERDAIGARGRNWLFFGDQRSSHDFLYEDELMELRSRGVLSRLDTAFSRDQSRKVYVQDRIIEQGNDLFGWIRDGAHIFVCGDAKRMARDVDQALHEVVAEHGGLSPEEAKNYIAAMIRTGRYQRDVY